MNLRERINFRLCVIFLSPGSWTFSLLELSTSFSFACSLVRKEYEQGKQNLQCSSIQRKWQGYLCSLNKQQFFGIVRKGHYVYISKEFSARMVRQNAWVVLLFNEKVGDVNIYIYIQWFWLQIVIWWIFVIVSKRKVKKKRLLWGKKNWNWIEIEQPFHSKEI